MSEQDPRERRKLRRLPAAELKLEWRPRKGLFTRFQAADGRDFTRHGVSMTINQEDSLQTGDRVEVNVQLLMEAGALGLDKLVATVRNVREDENNRPLYGLEFELQANRAMKSDQTKAQLGRIEGILERSEKLKLRIQPIEDIRSFNRSTD
ncbi:PilZ domain-containing protein [Marinobacter caseinilyticus]|uniref:PilZ domain-containing protein n=1 Tax=Marinobacter caseinilyticus TaxID=2692195 RepID=UPI00140A6BCF|nr:PilZ domain-containing protein [Marinobacter caseinilyticus]